MALYRQATPNELPKKAALLNKEADQSKQLPKNEATTFDDVVSNTAAIWLLANNHEQS